MPWHSHGWSTKDFLKEIDDLAQLYALSSCSTMATSMVASLGKKLSTAVSLRAGDYVSLMQHVDGSKLPEEQKLELQKTLGQVASSNGQLSVANKLAKEPQSMPNVPAYLTQADWDVLLHGDLDKALQAMLRCHAFQERCGLAAAGQHHAGLAGAFVLSVFLSKDKICAMEKGQGRFVHAACRSNPCPCDVDSIQS